MNIWAVLLAAVSSFLLGGSWYSPALFGLVALRGTRKGVPRCAT